MMDVNQFTNRLNRLTETTKPKWGKLNVNGMLAHMNDAFRIALGMKSSVDKSNFYTKYIMLPVALYVLPSWPKGNATAPEMAQEKAGTKPKDFYTELEFLKKMMDVFNERDETKLKHHPMFGQMSKKQWSLLLARHLDHHLKQFGV